MLRRSPLRLTLAAGAAAVALSGCATFTNTGGVADVDGAEISEESFDEVAAIYFEREDVFGTTPIENGRVDAEQLRFLLAALVRQQIFQNFIDEQGVDVSSIRDDFKTNVLEPSPIGEADLPEPFLDLIADIDGQMLATSFEQVGAPNIDELRALYAQRPASTGLACVRHIVVDTEADAEAVIDEARNGTDFAELAEERSIDPGAAGTGGAVQSPDSPCVSLDVVVQGFDPAFAAGILDAGEGIVSEPVESTLGWHVITARPWDEIGEAVGAMHQPGASGSLLFGGYIATAPVDIDAAFGTWNPLTSAVEPIG